MRYDRAVRCGPWTEGDLVIGGHPSCDGGHGGGLERRQSGVVRRALDVAAGEHTAVRRHDRDARRTVRVGTVALRSACRLVRTTALARVMLLRLQSAV